MHGGIAAHAVRRAFGDVVAVDGMDLEAPPGEVTALVGPNGAGKTTLLLVLATASWRLPPLPSRARRPRRGPPPRPPPAPRPVPPSPPAGPSLRPLAGF